jgi:hypothetical protein
MWMRYCLLALPVVSFAAAPTDAELLKFVKDRASSLERVTAETSSYEPPELPCSVGPIKPASPHGFAIRVFANESAVLPLFDPWGKFPEGSLLVKEKLNADRKSELFTGMWKRESGFFPEANDWEFFEVDAAASKIVARGKIASCASCHEEFKKGDQVFKEYILPAQLTGGRIVLHSSKAKVTGEKLRYEPEEKKNTLGYWTNPGDWASWSFEVSRPGTYDIHVWQGCGKGSGGSEVAVTTADQTSTFTVEDTGHFQNFKQRVIGRVTFKAAGPQTLEVRPRNKKGGAVMDLRQILLMPVAEGQAPIR